MSFIFFFLFFNNLIFRMILSLFILLFSIFIKFGNFDISSSIFLKSRFLIISSKKMISIVSSVSELNNFFKL